MTIRHHTKTAFTLIELVVAVTILGFIMLSVFLIYSNLVTVNTKLEQTRILQENVRIVTEKIATDVRESGLSFQTCNGFENSTKCLQMNNGNEYYLIDSAWSNSESGALGLKEASSSGDPVSLTSNAVIIKNLRFNVSGKSGSGVTNSDVEGKVQVVFDIGLSTRRGISKALSDSSFMTVQTTISEKIYKGN